MLNTPPELPPEGRCQLALINAEFQQELELIQQGRSEQALSAFESCFNVAAQGEYPLMIDQFTDILMQMSFCYADMHEWDDALRVYTRIKRVLKQEENWHQLIPSGITVMVPQRFDPAPYLAAVYDSIGLAYDNSNQVDQAMKYYRQAIEIYTRIQDLPRAARSWHHIAMGCQRRQDWTILQSAAKNMLQLYTHLADLNGQIAAWQYLAQASINQHRPAKMFEYLKLAVAVEKELGHPDLQRDETLLESFLADLRRKQVNARNRKTGGGHPLS